MPEPITPERLAEIQNRTHNATPGPWGVGNRTEIALDAKQDGPGSFSYTVKLATVIEDDDRQDDVYYLNPTTQPRAVASAEDDALFIAHARQDVDDLLAEVDRLKAENKRLRLDAEREEQTTGNLIDERDNFHALLDRFAAAVAPIEVIGEHSSGNDPWVNALDMVTPAAEVDRFRSVAYTQASMIPELTSACMAAETERDRLKAELAEMESAAADWAARLAELRSKAETRLDELADIERTHRKVDNKAGAARQDAAAAEIRSLFGIEWKPGGGEPRD